MTRYLAIYERNKDGWWAYVPDLPGCTAAGDDREEVERNAREAVAAHVDLLRATGRPVPEPTTHDASRIAVDAAFGVFDGLYDPGHLDRLRADERA